MPIVPVAAPGRQRAETRVRSVIEDDERMTTTGTTAPTPRGRARVVLDCGPAGAGKSTHTRELERKV